jgi:hypothetical protein
MTDSGGVFKYSIGKPFAHHDMTNHHKGEYARDGFIHSNTAESVFSLLKRGVYGTFHNVSRKHSIATLRSSIFGGTIVM